VRGRALLIGTALVSSILGAIVAYLVLTVPNDIEAGALMRQAKKEVDTHHTDRARETLALIVQQYPRTDAAASATLALLQLNDADRARLAAELAAVKRDLASQKQDLGGVSQKVAEIAAKPPPAPPPPPAPKPVPKKKAAAHHTRHRR
jgi:hypothetical protein